MYVLYCTHQRMLSRIYHHHVVCIPPPASQTPNIHDVPPSILTSHNNRNKSHPARAGSCSICLRANTASLLWFLWPQSLLHPSIPLGWVSEKKARGINLLLPLVPPLTVVDCSGSRGRCRVVPPSLGWSVQIVLVGTSEVIEGGALTPPWCCKRGGGGGFVREEERKRSTSKHRLGRIKGIRRARKRNEKDKKGARKEKGGREGGRRRWWDSCCLPSSLCEPRLFFHYCFFYIPEGVFTGVRM